MESHKLKHKQTAQGQAEHEAMLSAYSCLTRIRFLTSSIP